MVILTCTTQSDKHFDDQLQQHKGKGKHKSVEENAAAGNGKGKGKSVAKNAAASTGNNDVSGIAEAQSPGSSSEDSQSSVYEDGSLCTPTPTGSDDERLTIVADA